MLQRNEMVETTNWKCNCDVSVSQSEELEDEKTENEKWFRKCLFSMFFTHKNTFFLLIIANNNNTFCFFPSEWTCFLGLPFVLMTEHKCMSWFEWLCTLDIFRVFQKSNFNCFQLSLVLKELLWFRFGHSNNYYPIRIIILKKNYIRQSRTNVCIVQLLRSKRIYLNNFVQNLRIR